MNTPRPGKRRRNGLLVIACGLSMALRPTVSGAADAHTVRFANGLPAGDMVSVETDGLQVRNPRGETALLPWAQISISDRFRYQPGFRDQVGLVLDGQPLPDLPPPKPAEPVQPDSPKPGTASAPSSGAPATAKTPPPPALPANPVTKLIRGQPNDYDKNEMPEIKSRADVNFSPFGLRIGTGEKDIVFFLFSARRKPDTLPDTLHVWIPGNPEFSEPKPFRGRERDGKATFQDVVFSTEDAGVKRSFKFNLTRTAGENGNFQFDVMTTFEFQGKRTVMLYHHAASTTSVSHQPTKVRVVTMFEQPTLLLRVGGDGTDVSCNLSLGKEWSVLPQEGADTGITIEMFDSKGTLVETQTIPGNPATFMNTYSWTTKLKNVKKDEKYKVVAKINLGPWFGEQTAEAGTMMIDRRI